jgi:hypothetical protein
MAEEKKPAVPAAHAAHGDAKVENSSGLTVKSISKFVIWFTLIFFVVSFSVIIVIVNPTTAQNFIYFLQGLQVLFGVVVVFCFYKLQVFRKRFLATCHEIDHLFADKNGQGHGHGHGHHDDKGHHTQHGHDHVDKHDKFLHKKPENIFEERFQRAMKSVDSNHKEEWRLALIELDKLLKDLLLRKNYSGETIEELLNDAKSKKFSEAENAIIANKTKKMLLRNIVKMPEEKDRRLYVGAATLYKLAINDLMH